MKQILCMHIRSKLAPSLVAAAVTFSAGATPPDYVVDTVELWSFEGENTNDLMGMSHMGGDWDADDIGDVIVSTRRQSGDGYVVVLSGADGSEIFRFNPVDSTETTGFPTPFAAFADGESEPYYIAIGISEWASGEGVVFIYDWNTIDSETDGVLKFSAADASDEIWGVDGKDHGVGYNLDGGDLNGSGNMDDLAIGAFKYEYSTQINNGALFVLHDVLDLTDDEHTLVPADRVLRGLCAEVVSIGTIVIGNNNTSTTGDEIAVGARTYKDDDDVIYGRVRVWDDSGAGLVTLTPEDFSVPEDCGTLDVCDPKLFENRGCFGQRLARAGDVDDDGDIDLLIGSPASSSDGATGRAYVYTYGASGSYSWHATLEQSGTAAFGRDVSGVGDIDGDGRSDFAVADKGYDTIDNNNHGRVFVYSGRTISWSPQVLFTLTGKNDQDFLGEHLSMQQDLNNDGIHDFSVSAEKFDSSNKTNNGIVYLVATPTMPIESVSRVNGSLISGFPINTGNLDDSDDTYGGIESDANGKTKIKVTFDVSDYTGLAIGYIGFTVESHVEEVTSGNTMLAVRIEKSGGGWESIPTAGGTIDGTDRLFKKFVIDNQAIEHVVSDEVVIEISHENTTDEDFESYFDKATLVVSPGDDPVAQQAQGPPGDLDRDGFVASLDVIELISHMGPCGDCDECPADLNGDCVVDGADLVMLLGNWR